MVVEFWNKKYFECVEKCKVCGKRKFSWRQFPFMSARWWLPFEIFKKSARWWWLPFENFFLNQPGDDCYLKTVQQLLAFGITSSCQPGNDLKTFKKTGPASGFLDRPGHECHLKTFLKQSSKTFDLWGHFFKSALASLTDPTNASKNLILDPWSITYTISYRDTFLPTGLQWFSLNTLFEVAFSKGLKNVLFSSWGWPFQKS